MELAEMENETEAIDDVFVLCVLPPPLSLSFWLSPSFPSLSVIFRHYCLSFSVCPIQSAPLSLATPSTHSHPHTLTYKHRVITGLQGLITSVIQGFYMVAWS